MTIKLRSIDGLPVVDAKGIVQISVKQCDIDKADIKEPSNCAVARACRRELHAKEVRVHLTRVYIKSNEGNWVRYQTPPAMRSEIIAFDRGGSFEEGAFALRPVGATKRVGSQYTKKYRGKKYPLTGKRKRSAPRVLTNVRQGPALAVS